MTTFTIKISSRSKKAKYLLGLISELARTDKGIEIIESPTPNRTTRKAMKDAETSQVTRAESVDDLFDNI